MNYLNAPALAAVVIAGDIIREGFPCVLPGASLTEALDRFSRHDGERLPVVNNTYEHRLLGSISKTDVILAFAGSDRTGGAHVADSR